MISCATAPNISSLKHLPFSLPTNINENDILLVLSTSNQLPPEQESTSSSSSIHSTLISKENRNSSNSSHESELVASNSSLSKSSFDITSNNLGFDLTYYVIFVDTESQQHGGNSSSSHSITSIDIFDEESKSTISATLIYSSLSAFLQWLSDLNGHYRYALTYTQTVYQNLTQPQYLDSLRSSLSSLTRITQDEIDPICRRSLLSFLQSTRSSALSLRSRKFQNARLSAAESVDSLLVFLFALQGRVRPTYEALRWELKRQPLIDLTSVSINSDSQVRSSIEILSAENLSDALCRILDGDIETQSKIVALVEHLARQHPALLSVFSNWTEDQLNLIRPSGRPNKRGGGAQASTEKVLAYINRVNNFSYTLLRRLDGGLDVGAYLLQDNRDEKSFAVLKWSGNKDSVKQVLNSAKMIEKAIQLGYPTPARLATGTTPSGYPYSIQLFSKGQSCKLITIELVRSMIPIFELQRNFFLRHPMEEIKSFTVSSRQIVWENSDLHQIICNNPLTLPLHDIVMEWVTPYHSSNQLNIGNDLVHGDLNPTNILVDSSGSVIALVDADGMGRGSVIYDIATLLFSSYRQGEYHAFTQLLEYAITSVNQPGCLILSLSVRILSALRYSVYEKEVALKESMAMIKQFIFSIKKELERHDQQ